MAVSSLLLALAVAVILGGAATAWLWLVQRPRAEREEGLKLLAAMRWREFSKLVVDGLSSRGFEPEAVEEAAERGQDSVIHIKRGGEPWLLACKHGLNYRITQAMVGDMSDAVRFHGAAGGVVATLGEVDSDARKGHPGRVDVFDGHSLWPMVHTQLSPGVREELSGKAEGATKRQITIAWAAAITLGLVVALIGPKKAVEPEIPPIAQAASSPQPVVAAPAAPDSAAPAAAAPVSEDEQRDDVIRQVAAVAGVERVMWSTRSTLLIYLTDEAANPVDAVCTVMKNYEGLRTSRVHLQPPKGATRPARFLQCSTF